MKRIKSFTLSDEALNRLDNFAATAGRARSETLERIIMNVGAGAINRAVRLSPTYTEGADNAEGVHNN